MKYLKILVLFGLVYIVGVNNLRAQGKYVQDVVIEVSGGGEYLTFAYNIINAKSKDYLTVSIKQVRHKGKLLTPDKGLGGDWGTVSVGSGTSKYIEWKFVMDYPELEGKIEDGEVTARVVGQKIEIPGFKNVAQSMVVPHWGHKKLDRGVEPGKVAVTIGTYSLLAAGLGMELLAQSKYTKHKNENTDLELKQLYLNEANRARRPAVVLAGLGGGLWLSNLIWVNVRANKKRKKLFDRKPSDNKPSVTLRQMPVTNDWMVGVSVGF